VNVPDTTTTQFKFVPDSTAIPTTSTTISSVSSALAKTTSSLVPSPTQSAAGTSQFVTTPGMTNVIIGAIVGAFGVMLGLLCLFVLLRRRISRNSARKVDQGTSIGRNGGNLDKNRRNVQDAGSRSLWGTRKGDQSQLYLEPGLLESQGSSMNHSTTIPQPFIPVSSTFQQSVTTAYSHVKPAANSYDIPLETSLPSRNQQSEGADNNQSLLRRSVGHGTLRPTPPPINIPPLTPPSAAHSMTASASNITSWHSAAATLGEGDVPPYELHGMVARVMN